ncbi:hypothetical protein AVEN_120473-1 [Araneus ventricosus]|uniref:Uncharacterized protein n=1 Tax=Araneus ventricosus TaxID=182803 RepID=A0A4Y2NQG1_ARAVE|nr:hypothetical protein AVEN_120473-1 [Araneus ventricosus]
MSETWMYENEVIVEGFELKPFINNTLKSKNYRQDREARSVTIYKILGSVADSTPIHFTVHNKRRLQDIGAVDICTTDIAINGQSRCILPSVYIHPGVDAIPFENVLIQPTYRKIQRQVC